MKLVTLKVAIAIVAATLAGGVAAATPVTYLYDSGGFSGSPYLDSWSRFGTHFTAAFTFSNDVNPTMEGFQCLYSDSVHHNCGVGPQAGKLLNWSVTSGDFTLNASNAHFAQGFYPGLAISTYRTSGPASVSYLSFEMDVIGNDQSLGLEIIGRRFEGGNGTGDINVVFAKPGHEALNHGGPSVVTSYNYTGPGGLPGGSGGVTSAVPEPDTWALFILGFGMVSLVVRRRSHLDKA